MADLGCSITIGLGRTGSLPYSEAFFEGVVVSLVLCSVSNVAASVAEITLIRRRVAISEHVRTGG